MDTNEMTGKEFLKIFKTDLNIAIRYFILRFNKLPHILDVNIKINESKFYEKFIQYFNDKIELKVNDDVYYSVTSKIENMKYDFTLKNEVVFASSIDSNDFCIMYTDESILEKNMILKLLHESEYVKPEEIYFQILVSEESLNLRKVPLDSSSTFEIDQLYNNDLLEKLQNINSFIENDKTGLMLFHGDPGTGKTNFIKELIRNHPEESFIYIPSKLFNLIDSINFVNFFISNKNSIIIIEDAEALLIDREKGNYNISTLLNLTEGLLGEALGIRVICTFNCEVNKIDNALTRKGRLKFIHEFKPLEKKKANLLLKTLGSNNYTERDLTLSEIFHFLEENGFASTDNQTIGFK